MSKFNLAVKNIALFVYLTIVTLITWPLAVVVFAPFRRGRIYLSYCGTALLHLYRLICHNSVKTFTDEKYTKLCYEGGMALLGRDLKGNRI